jgi:PAS domain S-box-containing protein
MTGKGGDRMASSKSASVEMPERVQLLISHSNEIQRIWLDQLKNEWGIDGLLKIAILEQEQRDKKDLLSILVRRMSGVSENARVDVGIIVDKVRGEDYAVGDLLMEIACLENATEAVLRRSGEGPEIHILELMNDVRRTLGALLRSTVQETFAVYEKIVESGARGFCLFNAEGTIVSTNEEMKRLLDTRSAAGRLLESFFGANDRMVLRKMLSPEMAERPQTCRLDLLTDRGAVVPVGVEIGAVVLLGERKGGYLCAVDLSQPARLEKEIFDKFPLGVSKLTLNGEFTYMNPAGLRMLGLETCEGMTIRDIFPDHETYSEISMKLQERGEGHTYEYQIKLTRPQDGRKVPVMIAAVPETDSHGEIIRSMAIVRDRTLEEASETIHKYISTIMDYREMLNETVQEVAHLIPFDRFVVTQYSEDMAHLREFYSYDPAGPTKWEVRWWAIPARILEFLRRTELSRVDDLEEFLNQPGIQDLKARPEFTRILQEGFRSSLRVPVLRGDKAIAGVSLLSKKKKAYGEDEIRLFKALPLDKAVRMALYHEERRMLEFRLNLIRAIISTCDNIHDVAEIIVEQLSAQGQCDHISLFTIDEKKEQFCLLRQKALPGVPSLPKDFTLKFGKNALSTVYRSGESVYIPDTREDSSFRDIYEPALANMLSEFCLPIVMGGKVHWLLNMEDSHQNTFSKEEMDAIVVIVREISNVLDRAWLHHFLSATLNSTSDLVFVTDNQGKISQPNPEAAKQLGYTQQEMITKELKEIFTDPEGAQEVLKVESVKSKEINLRRNNGSSLPVLLSGSELPEDFGGKVFVCKDVSVFKRVKELEYLKQMYHEIAVQTQTPLSLAFGWIQSLKRETKGERTAETLDKALKQLKKVEMTYNRLALYDKEEGVLPYREMLLSISEVAGFVLSEFSKDERDRITDNREEKLPYLRGDLFQLTFCLETILSFLLRYLPLEEKIQLDIFQEKDWIITKIAGFFPDMEDQAPEEFMKQEAVSKTLVQMALADEVIKKFVDNHKGRFFRHTGERHQGVFEIHLPSAREEA